MSIHVQTVPDSAQSRATDKHIARWKRQIDRDVALREAMAMALNELIDQHGLNWWTDMIRRLDAAEGAGSADRIRELSIVLTPLGWEDGSARSAERWLGAAVDDGRRVRLPRDLLEDAMLVARYAVGDCIVCGAAGPFDAHLGGGDYRPAPNSTHCGCDPLAERRLTKHLSRMRRHLAAS